VFLKERKKLVESGKRKEAGGPGKRDGG